MINPQQNAADQFLLSVADWEECYVASLNYVALRSAKGFAIAKARLRFHLPPLFTPQTFASTNVRAARLAPTLPVRNLLERALNGDFIDDDREIYLPTDPFGNSVEHFHLLHEEGLQAQNRLSVLEIHRSRELIVQNQTQLDWELKAASTPFDSLQYFFNEFALGPIVDGLSVLEAIAANVVAVDVNSKISGTIATIGLRLAQKLDPARATLGYRLYSNGQVVSRASIEGKSANWHPLENIQRGEFEFAVPEGSVLHCVASYKGVAHHHYWIADLSKAQNPRRTIHEVADPQLAILTDFMARQGRGRNAHDLETAIAWLLSMLGFSVVDFGHNSKTTDFVDLVAATPRGNFVAVECTTGLLKADSKLPNLVRRSAAIRKSLQNSGNSHLRVLPMIVTSLSREDVKVDLETAEKEGVFVITADELQGAIERTVISHDADRLYSDAEEVVKAARAKYD